MQNRLVEKQVVYQGQRVRLEIHHLDHEPTGRRVRKEVVVHPGAVVVLAFLDDGRLLLIRNRRYAIGETLIELPAGTLEPKEDPINCAGRELLEETGYLARRIKPLPGFYPSPGILTERMHVFAAYDLTHQGQALEAGEEIEVLPTRLAEAIDMIRTGQIQDAKTIAAVLTYDRFYTHRVPVPGQAAPGT